MSQKSSETTKQLPYFFGHFKESFVVAHPEIVKKIGAQKMILLQDLIRWAAWKNGVAEWNWYPAKDIAEKWGWTISVVSDMFLYLQEQKYLKIKKCGKPQHNEYLLDIDLLSQVFSVPEPTVEAHMGPRENTTQHREKTRGSSGNHESYIKNKEYKEQKQRSTSYSYADFSSPTGFTPISDGRYPANEFLEFWNNLPNVRRHKPGTKVYKQAGKLIDALQKGLAGCSWPLDQKWLDRHNLTSDDLQRKWSDSQIKKGLERLAQMFDAGCWPTNKDWLPKDLTSLIFNPRANTSWLLKCLFTAPESMKKANIVEMTDTLSDHEHDVYIDLAQCVDNCRNEKLDDSEMKKLFYVVKDLSVFWDRLPSKAKRPFMHFRDFGRYYCKWLDGRVGGERKLSPAWLGPKGFSGLWREFRVWLEEDVGVNLEHIRV